MIVPATVVTCSSCDDYQLVPDGPDGILIRCLDCLEKTSVRCPVHGRSLRAGRCPSCGREAALAEVLLVRAHDRARAST